MTRPLFRSIKSVAMTAALTGVVAGAGAVAAFAAPAPVQPHRAVYSLQLEKAEAAADVSAIDGRMVLEWRGGQACNGYTVNQRIVTDIGDTDGRVVTRDLRLSSWESVDGNVFRFDLNQYVNGKLVDRVSGRATREDGAAAATFSSPEGTTLALPADVVFPSEFTVNLIRAARAGERIVSHPVFEGAETDRRFDVTAFVGRPQAAADDAVTATVSDGWGEPLATMTAWPVHMSYFDPQMTEGVPDYEVSYRLFPNGVTTSLLMDYGDFVLRGNLDKLDYLKPGDC